MAQKKDIEGIHYLSPLQQGLLFHAVAERGSDPYFVQAAFVLQGKLNLEAFERAWQMLTERHAILRTSFVYEGVAKPVQVIRTKVVVPVVRHDFLGMSEEAREWALECLLADDRARGLDLLKAPLMRLSLAQVDERSWYFVHTHHHLLLDGWSLSLLLREALIIYRALILGERPQLPPTRPFRDYLAWVHRQREVDAEQFWRDSLAGFSAPTPLPLAALAGSSSAASEAGFTHGERVLSFSAEETAALSEFARGHRLTLNTLVQGAWARVLAGHSGRYEVAFGATVSGRPAEVPGSETIVGLLINTLPVRVTFRTGERIFEWLARLQEQNSQLRQFEWTPLARIQAWSEVPRGQPLFESIVVFDSYPEGEAGTSPDDLDVSALPRPHQSTDDGAKLTLPRNNYPLSLIVEPTERLQLILNYDLPRIGHVTARTLLEGCRAALVGMARSTSDARVADVPWMSPEDHETLLKTWRQDTVQPGSERCIHELIEQHAKNTPDRFAVVCEEERLSYRKLDQRANQVARRLRSLGVVAEDRVVLCVERSVDAIVGLLGILKAGAAYVPLDTALPPERLRGLTGDCGARMVVTQDSLAAAFVDVPLVRLDGERDQLAKESSQKLEDVARPENLAYLIYTSGSTGRPKAVGVEHQQIVHYVEAIFARLPIARCASLAQVSTLAADLGHTSLFGALCSGNTLHLMTHGRTFDPDAMAEYMAREKVEALKIVPSHLTALLEAADPARVLPRSCLVLGGEASSIALAERVRTLAPDCAIFNHYGPTETTVGALTWAVDFTVSDLGASLPIGRPLPGMRAYILNRELAPVPVGVVGDLYLSGRGVARGYFGRPEQTAERFLADPFAGVAGERMYRTGDRARYREDGAIEFLGRIDHQVKLRGYRVELGEIEAQLRACPEVRDAVVMLRDDTKSKRLVAYVVAKANASFDQAALLAALTRTLPDYMIPSQLVELPSLPLSRNGKIDRSALPDPERARPSGPVRVPASELESTLVEIWRAVLGRESVSVNDDFFELGGDSILSLQIVARANQKGLRVPPKLIFAHRTVAALARALATQGGGVRSASVFCSRADPPASTPAPERRPFALARLDAAQLGALRDKYGDQLEDVFPATPVQQGMLFHALLTPETNPYFNQIVFGFSEGLELDAFERAFDALSARHAVLRTGIVSEGVSEPHQLMKRSARLPVEVRDLRGMSENARAEALAGYLRADRARGFHFEEAPWMRVAVFRVGPVAVEVVWSVHHALIDGWCQGLLLKEWLDLYQEARQGGSLSCPAAAPYRDYVAWLARQDRAAAESFFRTQLADFTTPTRLPERGGRRAAPLTPFREHRLRLAPGTTRTVQELARARGLTLNTVVQAAWALVLARVSGQEDVLFGVTVAGRPTDLPGAETIMGVFINSLPLRIRVSPAVRVAEWLPQIQELNLELRQYEYTPLLDVQGWSAVPRGTPLFDSLLVFQNYPLDAALEEHRSSLGIELKAEEAWTHYPLTLHVSPGEELTLSFTYDAQRLDGCVVESLAGAMSVALEGMATRPEEPIGALPLLDINTQARLAQVNETRRELPTTTDFCDLLAAQAARTPGAVAVRCGGQQLTYAELSLQVNALARQLRARGAGPEKLVGVFTERSPDMLVGLLAVLKSGAAYVPLDPSYPMERLRLMMEDSGLSLLLVQHALLDRVPPGAPGVIALSSDVTSIADEPLSASWARAHPEHPAYVIYTSGSTGRPKGVVVRRKALLNFLLSMREKLGFGHETWMLAATSISFDIATLELFGPLLAGGTVIMASREEATDPERLAQLLHTSRANVFQATPTAWKMLLDNARPNLRVLKALCGGEPLSRQLAKQLVDDCSEVWNLYGPTETTVWSSAEPIACADGLVFLGRPIDNTEIHVLDRQLHPVPLGIPGDLYIGGEGLARGYLGRPDLTAERFIPDPFHTGGDRRLYRTGDVARFDVNGALEFLGRSDQQVKVRGFRIELGEVEAALKDHPAIHDAAVIVHVDARDSSDSSNDGTQSARLIGYLVTPGDMPEPEVLRAFLRAKLPDHMIPADFTPLRAFPRTPNGKLDRNALPAPGVRTRAAEVQPSTETEQRLAQIWCEVLGVDSVGAHESFFALGGHSLLATQVVARARQAFGLELPLRSLFEQSTISALAQEIETRRGTAARKDVPIVALPRKAGIPLSFAQQRLWFLAQLEPESAEYNMTAAVRIRGDLDLAKLEQSFKQLIARHEPLRTTFGTEAGEPLQYVAESASFPFGLAELAEFSEAERTLRVEQMAESLAAQPFDLTRGPLLRVSVGKLAPDEHVVVLVVHHIVIDGWSMNVLVSELAELYQALRQQRLPALPPLPVQYADFAVWQRAWMAEPERAAQLAFWKQRLAHLPARLALPSNVQRTEQSDYRGGRHSVTLDPALTSALAKLSQEERGTLFMVLLTLYKVLLFRRTRQTDLLVGTDVANRVRPETEGMIGFFVNLLALRSDLSSVPTFRELLRSVRATALEAFANQDVPFEQVVDAVRAGRGESRGPLVQTLFVLQNQPWQEIVLSDIQLSSVALAWEVSRFDLGVFVEEIDGGLTMAWRYRASLFESATIASMAEEFVELTRAAIARPDARITALLPEAISTSASQAQSDRLKRLKQIAPRRVAPGAGTLVASRTFEGGLLPLVLEPRAAGVNLAAWAREERGWLEKRLAEHGALLFRGFGLSSVADFEGVARSLCGELFGEYGDLPREKTGTQVYGSTPYPADKSILFHNESSHLPRWPMRQFFFCVQAAQQGGATPIVDSRRVCALLPPELRERFEKLGLLYIRNFTPGFDVRWQDFFHTDDRSVVEARCRESRMGCEWLGDRLRITQRGPAVLCHPESGAPVFFNQVQLHHPAYLEVAVRDSLMAMLGEDWLPRNVRFGDGSPIDQATTKILAELYECCAVRFHWQAGDMLMLDNMLVAHARDPFVGPRKIVVAMGDMRTSEARSGNEARGASREQDKEV